MNRRNLLIIMVILLVSVMQAQKLLRVEYFFDTDPGYGKGFALNQPALGENTYEMSFESVGPGYHLLSLRAQDEYGRWSTVISRPIFVVNPQEVAAVEYFIDEDPGEGNAEAITLPDDLSKPFAFEVSTNQLKPGEHLLCVRAKGDDGLWTYISSQSFTVEAESGDANGDGTINAADIVEVVNYIMNNPSEKFDEKSADANGDGVVNAADIVTIVNIIMGN